MQSLQCNVSVKNATKMANLGALTCVPLGLSLARSGSVYVVWYVAYIFSKAQKQKKVGWHGNDTACCRSRFHFGDMRRGIFGVGGTGFPDYLLKLDVR